MKTPKTRKLSALLGAALLGFIPQGVQAAPPGEAGKVVVRVGKGQDAEYALIQAAVDRAPPGATVLIGPGAYQEAVSVRKPLSLEGAGWSQTTLTIPPVDQTALKMAVADWETRLRAAQNEQEKRAIGEECLQKRFPPPLMVRDARNVHVRGMKITASEIAPDTPYPAGALVIVRRAKLHMTDCAILGSPRGGVWIVDGSDVEIRRTLVAGVWQTGITVGERGEGGGSRAIVADCDLRNCRYAGICIRAGNEATVERCRISGAAWHGIRYDDTSPTITGNLIFGNARCGIYASGKTAATVQGNLFWNNEMGGMSCFFANRDKIAKNTFADNQQAALAVIDGSEPRVEQNIFYGHPTAITCNRTRDAQAAAVAVANLILRKNLFWKNEKNCSRGNPNPDGRTVAWDDTKLSPETASVELDPQFASAETGDFSLSADSPARRGGVGAAAPLGLASPWPLQPEERAIIPDGPSRDVKLWKKPLAKFDTELAGSSKGTDAAPPELVAGPRPPAAFLYHIDPQVRIRTIELLAATRDAELIDDLIRAHAVEYYTPVHNAYSKALQAMTGQRGPRSPGAWKAWLAQESAAVRLQIDYVPLQLEVLSPDERGKIQPLAAKLGFQHFDRMVGDLTAEKGDAGARSEALRYLVANDNCEEVQKFLGSDWVVSFLALNDLKPPMINAFSYALGGLADPGPLRERINVQLRECLDSEDPIILANTLHVLAGVEGYSTRLVVPDVAEKVRRLLDHPAAQVAAQARRAMNQVDPKWAASDVSYEEAFQDLYEVLGREYPCFALKGIDWKVVGSELLPRVKQVKTDDEFGLLCLELVARLEDSHAHLGPGTANLPAVAVPRFDPGFACLMDDRGKPVVYYVDQGGPAEQAGVCAGMTVVSLQRKPSEEVLSERMRELSRYNGYSSDRYLRYHAAQFLPRQLERGSTVVLEMQDVDGKTRAFSLPAVLDIRYLPRLPVPIPGIRDSGNVSWTMLPPGQDSPSSSKIGYLYVRRIRNDLVEQLDRAIGELKDAHGLVIDVRGNSGGGFDGSRSHRNFALDDDGEPQRPRFRGPIALLIDSRCISAGEGWASWFVARKRARLFGEATAGASSAKRTYTLKNGLYTVTIPVRPRTGFLDRPIERRGLEPDVLLRQNARDLAAGRDTVLEAARRYLQQQE